MSVFEREIEGLRILIRWISESWENVTASANAGEWIWLILAFSTMLIKIVGFSIWQNMVRYQRKESEQYPGQNNLEYYLAHSYRADRVIFLVVQLHALIAGIAVCLTPPVDSTAPISVSGWVIYSLIYVYEIAFTTLAARVIIRSLVATRLAKDRLLRTGWTPGTPLRRATDPFIIPTVTDDEKGEDNGDDAK